VPGGGGAVAGYLEGGLLLGKPNGILLPGLLCLGQQGQGGIQYGLGFGNAEPGRAIVEAEQDGTGRDRVILLDGDLGDATGLAGVEGSDPFLQIDVTVANHEFPSGLRDQHRGCPWRPGTLPA
jgi:hypothetical protein